MIDPCLRSRRLVTVLKRDYNAEINRKRLQRLRRVIGHEAIWCTDITYVPMPGSHADLYAVTDWYSRKVLRWVVSNTMDTALCLEAL